MKLTDWVSLFLTLRDPLARASRPTDDWLYLQSIPQAQPDRDQTFQWSTEDSQAEVQLV